MPKRRRRARRTGRRVRRRRTGRFRRRRGMRMKLFRSPVPKTMRVAFKWAEHGFLSDAGSIKSKVYTANYMQSPDSTDTTRNPLGYDQLQGFYGRVVVVSSRITVQWYNDSLADSRIVAIQRDTSLTPPTSMINEIENRSIRYSMIGGTAKGTSLRQSMTYNHRRDLRLPLSSTSISTNYDSATAPPAIATFFIITASTADETGALGVTRFLTTITYNCLLTDPNDLVGS